MPSRRDFFKRVAGATAGAFVMGRGRLHAGQTPATGRRQVSIGGRRIRVVDVHAHCTVPEVAAVVRGTPFEGGAAALDRSLGPARIDMIDRQGIDIQALSINQWWWYAVQDRDLANRIVRAQNEGLARWVSMYADRFVAFASTSLQFPDLAAEQLEYGITRLGLRGAAVGGHVNGESLSLPKYDPFWAKAAALGALVFMHPLSASNIAKPDAWDGSGDLGNTIGNPLETTYFLSRLIFDGVFDKFPGLKVCGAHGAGYLPSYFQRTEVACDVRPDAKCANKKHPREYLTSNIMADTIVFSDEALRHLVAEMGVSQIVYGTDNPVDFPVTIDLVLDASFLSNAEKEAILGGNLIRLLRINSA